MPQNAEPNFSFNSTESIYFVVKSFKKVKNLKNTDYFAKILYSQIFTII